MALAVDQANNTLIIRAPDALFQEVAEIVQLIDKNAEQATEVISIDGLNPAYVHRLLLQVTGQQSNNTPANNNNSNNNPPPAASPQRTRPVSPQRR